MIEPVQGFNIHVGLDASIGGNATIIDQAKGKQKLRVCFGLTD